MGAFYRHILYPLYHGLKRDGVNLARREFERNQWLTTGELLELQQAKLRKLLITSYNFVPYYRQVFQNLGLKSEVEVANSNFDQIPVLTKKIIRENQDGLLSRNLAGNRLISNSTSGSTGEAIKFYTDTNSITFRKVAGIRSNLWAGWTLGDRYVNLWGSAIDEKRVTKYDRRIRSFLMGSMFLSSFDLSAEKMQAYAERMAKFKPKILLAYPGPLERFAIFCQTHAIVFPTLKSIVSSAETLWPHQRKIIEEAFGVKVFDRYGSREFGQVAAQCEQLENLHVSIDRVRLELVNGNGEECVPGEIGRILITDLDNFGMPMIRYDIGDRAAYASEAVCPCGRGLPLLEKIEGRTLEVVRTPDGREIGGTFWTLLLRSKPAFNKFQVVQNTLNEVQVRYVRGVDYHDSMLDHFKSKVKENLGSTLHVRFTEETEIDLNVAGKQRLVVSNLAKPPSVSDLTPPTSPVQSKSDNPVI